MELACFASLTGVDRGRLESSLKFRARVSRRSEGDSEGKIVRGANVALNTPFNIPQNSPAVSQQQKSNLISPTVRPLKLSRALVSPVPAPSRALNYKFPAASPFNNSTNPNASMSTNVPPSPSSLLSSFKTYRGKHPQSFGSEHCVHLHETGGPTNRRNSVKGARTGLQSLQSNLMITIHNTGAWLLEPRGGFRALVKKLFVCHRRCFVVA